MVSFFRRLFQKSVKPAPAVSGAAKLVTAGPAAGFRPGAVMATGPVRRPLEAGGVTPLFRLSEVTMERAAAAGQAFSERALGDEVSETELDEELKSAGPAQDRAETGKPEGDSLPKPVPAFPSPAAAGEEGAIPEREDSLKEAAKSRQTADPAVAVNLPLLPPVTPIQPIAIRRQPVAAVAPAMVALPLRSALRDADAGQLGFPPAEVPDGVVLNLPLALVRPQLVEGRVEIGLEDLRQGVLDANRRAFDRAAPDLRVVVPLSELFPVLPPDVIPGAGEWKGGTENAAPSGPSGEPSWPADDQDFMTAFRDLSEGFPDTLPSSPPPPPVETSCAALAPIPAALAPKAAPASAPVPAIALPPASPLPAPVAAVSAPTTVPRLPALPPLVRRNTGMFSRPPGSSPLPPVVRQADGTVGESAGNLPRITPLPLLSKAPTLPAISPSSTAPALPDPLPSPLPLPTEIPASLPTLTVLTDCGNLPGDDDDLGQPYPAGALTVEPPFTGRTANPNPNPGSAPQISGEPPAVTTLQASDTGSARTTAPQQPPPENPQSRAPIVPAASAVPAALSPATPAALPELPALPALEPWQADPQATVPLLASLPDLKPFSAPASAVLPQPLSLPGDDFEDLSFGCVTDSTQLTLRAIFGTDQRMTPQEVLGHCARLPGLRACVLLRRDSDPLYSEGLTEAETQTFARRAARISELVLALGESSAAAVPLQAQAGGSSSSNFTLRSDTGVQSFFLAGDLCLAVWHREAAFFTGIREKLTLAAQELARLDS